MTAVEWLESKMPIAFKDLTINKQLIKQAKEMEKQQTLPKEENKEGFGELSDAKIKDVAFKLGIASNIATTYFIEGAKWYRDKSKYIDNDVVK